MLAFHLTPQEGVSAGHQYLFLPYYILSTYSSRHHELYSYSTCKHRYAVYDGIVNLIFMVMDRLVALLSSLKIANYISLSGLQLQERCKVHAVLRCRVYTFTSTINVLYHLIYLSKEQAAGSSNMIF